LGSFACGASSGPDDQSSTIPDSTVVVPDVPTTDAEPSDTTDAGNPDVRPDVPVEKSPIQTLTSGSATLSSPNFTLRLSIGLPAPMGSSQSTNFRLKLGPEAVR
jgi:hypothetical protein